MSYEEAKSKFDRVNSELPVAEKKLEEIQVKLRSLDNSLVRKNQELTQ